MKHALQTQDEIYAAQKEASEREDLVMFINACFAATGQTEYYSSRGAGRISIDFLHSYVLANYRTVYRRVLAAGVNDFNRARIVLKLLAAGAPTAKTERVEEGELISATLRGLPANRVFTLFTRLREAKVNNRRTRAVIRDYIRWRSNPAFDASEVSNEGSHCRSPCPSQSGSGIGELSVCVEGTKAL